MNVLIYLEEDRVAPVGGPLGVGYHIKQAAEKKGLDCIHFLPGNAAQLQKEAGQKSWLYQHKRLTKAVRSFRHIDEYQKMFYSPVDTSDYLNQFDIIHFHRTSDMYKQRKSLENYRGKVIVTSHSPVPLAQELLAASATGVELAYMKHNLKKFQEMDSWAFRNADYIVFPCEDAEEPYYLNWEEYADIHEQRKAHYRYIPTGISDISVSADRSSVRDKFGISNEEFVVVYAGRHNEVKGYDSLKRIGERYLSNHRDTRFLIAGTEGPLMRLDHPKWTEVGWTREVHNIINAGDVFVLPNKFTYFDLIMIEVLALGKIVVASRTGGNKFFEKAGVEGVFLYDTEEEACDALDRIKEMSSVQREALGQKNRLFYENHLTSEKYVDSYLALLNDVFAEEA
ncbi:MAG: glycosyltransferase family 4 protein [Clostridiales bacterium]|nr:glycosyltransferase family 4 protein [Clostridiales bacterium]